jgi:hypothetical protein
VTSGKTDTVKVVEAWASFEPPVNLRRAVERLLSHVPAMYVAGLDRVVLRDSATLTSKEKQKRKSRKGKALLGTYYHGTSSSKAYIDLFVDEISHHWYVWMLRVPLLRDLLLAKVLFHELGHHVHRRIVPGHGDAELAAEKWRRELTRQVLGRRYWYLLPLLKAAARVLPASKRRGRRPAERSEHGA